jgi:hypothetical protein
MTDTSMTRRAALAGSAALAALPAFGIAAGAAPAATPIGTHWDKAEALAVKLDAYRAEIARIAQNGGISGWMRMGGEANRLGNERYGALVSIFTEEPRSGRDLAIMARALLDEEIQNGAKSWAAEQFARATIAFHAADLA